MQKIFICVVIISAPFILKAQTPVRNEPRHHNVFENNYVRLLDVHFAPKDTTQYHLHNTPSVFTTFTKTATGSRIKDKEPVSTVSVAGETWYDSLVTPRYHQVWNEDTSWFHVMDAELTSTIALSKAEVLQFSSLKLLYNEPLVNVYHLQLKKGENVELPSSNTGYLLISLGDASVDYSANNNIQKRIMKAGHYIWISAAEKAALLITNDATSGFTLLQMK
ncbi:MAG: hypothetical protein HYX40_12710 [Sphingobacteriales bacterium]|nr:hypothetical protein [Sphingobacteriales bacterium]